MNSSRLDTTQSSFAFDNEQDQDDFFVYLQAVEDSEFEKRLEIHNRLKDQGHAYWTEWVSFVEQRTVDAKKKITQKQELAKRVRYLLHSTRKDHETAIAELKNCIITEENSNGLIPVSITEFVIDNMVDTKKLFLVLGKVQKAWEKKIKDEKERKSGWQDELGKLISLPMSELD